MDTPWGKSDSEKQYAPGVTFYGTPGHGGFYLHNIPNAQIPEYMRNSNGWYEEDCEWSIVGVVFPQYFTPDEQLTAKETLRNWFPAFYERFYNTTILPGESFIKDEDAHQTKHANDYIVCTAWGDWHEKVPKGFVTVYAVRGGRNKNGGYASQDAKYFQIPYSEYNARNFVVDTARHAEVEAIQ